MSQHLQRVCGVCDAGRYATGSVPMGAAPSESRRLRDVADYTDDCEGGVLSLEVISDGQRISVKAARESGVDDSGVFGIGRIAIANRTPGQNGNAQRGEESWSDVSEARPSLCSRSAPVQDCDQVVQPAFIRHAKADGCVADAGNLAHRGYASVEQVLECRRSVVTHVVERSRSRHDVVRIKSRRQCLEVNERTNQQAGCNQQNHSEGHLRRDQRLARTAGSAGDSAAPGERRRSQRKAANLQCRQSPAQKAGQDGGSQSKAEHSGIDEKSATGIMDSGSSLRSASRVKTARPTPAMPPKSATTRSSVHNSKSTSRRDPPSANRVAISCRRRNRRTSAKPARFAQAMSKMKPTASINTITLPRMSPASSSCSGRAWMSAWPRYLVSSSAK